MDLFLLYYFDFVIEAKVVFKMLIISVNSINLVTHCFVSAGDRKNPKDADVVTQGLTK